MSAKHTLSRQSSLPLGSDSSVSQMRTASGKGNSWVSSRVIHRKAKNWGSTCKGGWRGGGGGGGGHLVGLGGDDGGKGSG